MSATETFVQRGRIDHDCSNCRGRNARLAQQLERTRDRFRLSGGTMANVAPGVVNVDIFRIDVPEELAVGASRTVRIGVRVIGGVPSAGTDADSCIAPGFRAGIEIQATVREGANERLRETHCIGRNQSNVAELQIPAVGETPGTVTFDVEVAGAGSGNVLATQSYSFEVVETAGGGGGGRGGTVPACTTDADCPPGQVCRNGQCIPEEEAGGFTLPCFLDPDQSCSTGESVGWGAGVLALVLLLAG